MMLLLLLFVLIVAIVDEKKRLEQRAAQLEEEANRLRLETASTRGAAQVLDEQAEEVRFRAIHSIGVSCECCTLTHIFIAIDTNRHQAATRARRKAIAAEKRAAKAELEEVRIEKRLEAERLRLEAAKDRSKLEQKTKSVSFVVVEWRFERFLMFVVVGGAIGRGRCAARGGACGQARG
jgi:hypothetical protein